MDNDQRRRDELDHSPLLVQHAKQIIEYLSKAAGEQFWQQHCFNWGFSWHYPHAESPAEVVFEMWWRCLVWLAGYELKLVPQVEVFVGDRRYRLDFTVELSNPWFIAEVNARRMRWAPIVIEIDGHTFHEKTKDQVTNRNQRDRDLQALGATIFHFSYDELTSEPLRCAGDVLSLGHDQLAALQKAMEGRPE